MPRIPYVPIDLAEPRELVEAIRARRGGQLSHLDRLLLHSPQLASGWKLNGSRKVVRIGPCGLDVPGRAQALELRHGHPQPA